MSTIQFSILTSTNGSTQKRLIPGPDGRPVKDPNHDLGIYSGQVEMVEVDSLAAFADVLANIKHNQALTLGVTGSTDPQKIVTKDKRAAMTYRGNRIVSRTLDYFSWGNGYYAILLDHDPEPGRADIDDEQLWARWCHIMPEFANGGRVVTVSSSSAIYDKATGACLKPASGHHTFVIVRGDVGRFKGILEARCWLQGEAFFKLGSPNKKTGVAAALERFLVDGAVFSPERLVYEAGADIDPGAPFEQRKPSPRVFEGDYIDLDAIPDLTQVEQDQAAANRKQALDAIKPQRVATVAAHVANEQPDLTQAGAYAIARQRVKECDRGELTPDHQLYLADGRVINAGNIGPEHHGVKLRDPQEPQYRGGTINSIIYFDGPSGWLIHSQAHGGKNYRLASAAAAPKESTKSTKALRRKQTVERAKAILNRALPKADRETSGGYLPALPPLAPGCSGYAMDAGLGGGKTTTIGRDIVAPTRAAGGFTFELEPRNSLGKQAAEDHNLPHIHHFGTQAADNQALGAMARDQGGMVLCPNSLPRAVQHAPSNTTMVIDEVMATLTEACEGGTLKGRYSETVSLLFDQMRQAEALHIAESNLDQPTLDLGQRVSGKRFMVIRHHGSVDPWQVHLATGGSPNGMFAQMAHQLKLGDRVWLTATSLDELTAWDLWATDNGINSVLITGETNESGVFDDFFANPDDYLENNNVQFLLTNQSVQTGLSVERYRFDAVYAYAPGFPVEVVYQMMGRYRLPCPRYAWVPEFIPPSRWERPRKESALAEINHELGQWAARGFASSAADPDQAAIDDYLAARWEKAWAQKVIPGQALTMMLERSGHTVTPWELAPDEAMKELRATYREKLARNRAEFHAGLAIDPAVHTSEWIKKKRDDGEATYQDRCILRKLSTLEKFPGIDWDSSEIWYQAWFMPRQYDGGEQTHGPIGPGASLWAECGAADLLQGKAGDEAAAILAQRLRSIKLLPDYGAKLAILAPMRHLCEQILAQGTTAPGCSLVRRLAAMARAVGDDLYRYLRIVAGDDHSDQAIAHKILRKFGLTIARSTYRKVGRARQWAYTVTAPPLWQPLVEARQKALEALQAKASTGVTDLLEGQFNKSVTPPPPDIPPSAWDELRDMLNQAMEDGAAAMAGLKEVVLAAFTPQVWAVLEVAS